MSSNIYSFDNVVFANLVFYGTLALLKVVIISPMTSLFRMKNGSYGSIEDAKLFAPNNPEKQKRLLRPNETIERVSYLCWMQSCMFWCALYSQIRRAHLNDLENVIPFVLLSLLYVGTNPDPIVALWHFRVSDRIVVAFMFCCTFRTLCFELLYMVRIIYHDYDQF